ncbi:MAG TPA: hypothetical protein VFT74_03655, partial [Isosphaeraceae bacterium]|nr:hypothetical protein [Isosphaeraceae bacterium]
MTNSTANHTPVKQNLTVVLPNYGLAKMDRELGIFPVQFANGREGFRVGKMTFAKLEAARTYGLNLQSKRFGGIIDTPAPTVRWAGVSNW